MKELQPVLYKKLKLSDLSPVPVKEEPKKVVEKEKVPIDGICSYLTCGKKRLVMEFYKCKTCRLEGGMGMCKACFDECHPGHETYYCHKSNSAYCDCFTIKCKF